jgi:hypothetical protein
MLIRALILFVALTAHIWLWGHWSFGKSTQLTLLLILNSVLALFVFSYPIHYLINKNRIKEVFDKKWFLALIYLYILLTIVLSMSSFYGLIQYLLPIKILLILIFTYLKWQGRQLRLSHSAKSSEKS